MRYSKYSAGAACLFALLPMAVKAQRAESAVPLKNWAAPLYWQPTQTERAASGKAQPELQFSANAISTDALTFVAITPCRLADTRGGGSGFIGSSPFNGPSIAAAGTLTLPVQSATQTNTTAPAPCGAIPTIAQAYSFNLTVVPSAPGTQIDFVTMWPSGSAKPFVATLNDPQGLIAGNAAIVPAGSPFGGISVYNAGPGVTDVVIDMNGYYAAPTDVSGNTALGTQTLAANTGGIDNTATGYQAMQFNTTGGDNVAIGAQALQNNTSGASNTASGFVALQGNTTGRWNTATGANVLQSNTTGNFNTGTGVQSLLNNTTGINNTAEGADALGFNTTGSNNVALGYQAAYNVANGNSNNIHIGSVGSVGDNATIRVGTPGTQTSFFVGGVGGVTTGAANAVPVVIDSNGQLGTISSSQRFKEDIHDMGDASSGLMRLRPVTFRYKQPYEDGSKPVDYGLIAEEVAKVYPDLAVKGADGQIQTVQYQKLTPMLLNELQKQAEQIRRQDEVNRSLEERLAALEALLTPAPVPAPDPSH